MNFETNKNNDSNNNIYNIQHARKEVVTDYMKGHIKVMLISAITKTSKDNVLRDKFFIFILCTYEV